MKKTPLNSSFELKLISPLLLMRRLRSVVLSVVIIFVSQSLPYAQDPSYFFSVDNPVYLNPALVGAVRSPRIGVNSRQQWNSLAGNYSTNSIYGDSGFKLKGSQGTAELGAGVFLLDDAAGHGVFKTKSVSVAGSIAFRSYQLKRGVRTEFRFGLEGGGVQRVVDKGSLTFPDMIDPLHGFVYTSALAGKSIDAQYFNFNAGFSWTRGVIFNRKKFNRKTHYVSLLSLSVHHLNEPNESVYFGPSTLPRRYSALWRLSPKKSGYGFLGRVSSQGAYRMGEFGAFHKFPQGVKYEMDAGVSIRGLLVQRYYDAIMLRAGLMIKKGQAKERLKLNVGYEINISSIGPFRNSFEVGLVIFFENPRGKIFSEYCPDCGGAYL